MKILVVGSDYGTVDMVNEAHKCGDYVVVADYSISISRLFVMGFI